MASPHPRPLAPGALPSGFSFPLILLLLGPALLGCGDKEQQGQSQPTREPRIVFANASPDVAFVGSAACMECHEEEAKAHAGHPHARSFGVVDPSTEPTGDLWHEPSAMTYRVDLHEGALRVRGSLKMEDGSEQLLSEHTLTHWIGSGGAIRHFVAAPEGFSMLAPLAQTPAGEGWQIDPMADRPLQPDFARVLEPTCVHCHAGRAEQVDETLHKFRFEEAAMGCERCHGPGDLHVRHQRKLAEAGKPNESEAPDLTIANPAHMTRSGALAVCAQCHMSDALTVLRAGKRRSDWHPALPWEDVQVTFRIEGRPHEIPLAGHVDQLAGSRCYTASDTLQCATCHEPHAGSEAAAVRKLSRAACIECHTACDREDAPAVPKANDACLDCHMPATAREDPHEVAHDHRIRVHRKMAGEDAREEARVEDAARASLGLVAFLGDPARLPAPARDRTQGIAWTVQIPRFSDSERRDEVQAEARALLERALEGGLDDVHVRHMLASLGEGKAAREAARKVIADALRGTAEGSGPTLSPDEVVALAEQMLILLPPMSAGLEEFGLAVEELVRRRRRAEDWSALGHHRAMQSAPDRQLEAILKAASIWPTNPAMQSARAGALRDAGKKEAGAQAERIFLRLNKQQSYVPPRKPR